MLQILRITPCVRGKSPFFCFLLAAWPIRIRRITVMGLCPFVVWGYPKGSVKIVEIQRKISQIALECTEKKFLLRNVPPSLIEAYELISIIISNLTNKGFLFIFLPKLLWHLFSIIYLLWCCELLVDVEFDPWTDPGPTSETSGSDSIDKSREI